MALRTIIFIAALGFFSAVFPAKLLAMPYGAVTGGVAFGVLLAAYLCTKSRGTWSWFPSRLGSHSRLPLCRPSRS